jgi:hypothetical protein
MVRRPVHSRKEPEEIQPFCFTSYGTVIGKASSVPELYQEMKKLAKDNRPCLEYHLVQGHLVSWLDYAQEQELAKELSGIRNIESALVLVERHLVRSVAFHGMRNRRPR